MIARGPRWTLTAAAVLALGAVPARQSDLAALAQEVRQAFLHHTFASVLSDALDVRLRLPGQPLGAGVRGDVAAAALAAYTRRHVELGIDVLGAAVVAPGHGYVELKRRFRTVAVDQEQVQRVLVSGRLVGGRWRVVELWIVDQ